MPPDTITGYVSGADTAAANCFTESGQPDRQRHCRLPGRHLPHHRQPCRHSLRQELHLRLPPPAPSPSPGRGASAYTITWNPASRSSTAPPSAAPPASRPAPASPSSFTYAARLPGYFQSASTAVAVTATFTPADSVDYSGQSVYRQHHRHPGHPHGCG